MKKVLSFSNDAFILEEIGEDGKNLSEEIITTFNIVQIKNDKTAIFGINNTDKIVKFDEFKPSWMISQRLVYLFNNSWITIFDMNDILSITTFSKKIVIEFNNGSRTVFYFATSNDINNTMKDFLKCFPERSFQFQIAFICCLNDLEKEATKTSFENITEIVNFINKNENKNNTIILSTPYGSKITNDVIDKCEKFNREQNDNSAQ